VQQKLIPAYAAAILTLAAGCGDQKTSINHHHDDSLSRGGSAADSASGRDGHYHESQDALPGQRTTTHMSFVATPSRIEAGRQTTWKLTIIDDSTGRPVEKFATGHEKLMHLIVVSNDLAWFNHLHPEYLGNGEFTVTTTLPHPGTYKLYADYTPDGRNQEVPQQEITTDGASPAVPSAPVPDTIGERGWMTRKVTSHPEGDPETAPGPSYEVAMMPMPMELVAGQDAMLHFQVRDGSAKPINDLEPYLGAMGHAVILSSDTRVYLHAHPMEGGTESMSHEGMKHDMGAMGSSAGKSSAAPSSGGPDVIFHTNFPTPGLYKVWGQFQHRGKIITAPFVVSVAPRS
jgi:hypothetical protein